MPYAEGRVYYDADSHLMETSDWLVAYADPDVRERIRPLYLGGAGRDGRRSRASGRRARKAGGVELDDIEAELLTRKGWHAYGAFDPRRAQPRPRPARLRQAARVLHVRADAVPRRRPRPALRRHPRAQPGDGRVLRRRRPADRRRVRAAAGSDSGPPKRSTRRSRSAAARSWCRRIRRARTRRRIPTSTACGPGCRTPACRSCCTSAAAGGRCGRASTRTDDPGRPTSSAAARTSGRRTTWSCTTRPRCSSRPWCSTACSRSSRG